MYLVFIDFSKSSLTALTVAAHLAEHNSGEIHLVHVLPQEDMIYDREEVEESINENRKKDALQQLEKLGKVANLKGKLHITSEVVLAMEEAEFLMLLRSLKPSLIISGLAQNEGILKGLKDHSAADFLNFSVVPVLFVPQDFKIPAAFKILTAVDMGKDRLPDHSCISNVFPENSMSWITFNNPERPLINKTIEQFMDRNEVEHWVFKKGAAISEGLLDYSAENNYNLLAIFPEDLSHKGFFVSGISEKLLGKTTIPVLAVPFHSVKD